MRVRALILLLCALIGFAFRSFAQDAQTIPQDAYIWQRVWDEPVRDAVRQHATNFSGLVALSVEVTWKQSHAQVVRVPVNYAVLRETKCPVGLALRIGPYPGPFAGDGQPINQLVEVAKSLVAEAEKNGLTPSELQIDFDCAESKLDGYRVWLQAIRQQVAPVPVIITALPTWLNQKSFQKLAEASDGYVLQVHSLERPKGPDAGFSICDPVAARKAVERAGQIGVPFRVALPTYGYVVAFGTNGGLTGLSAEGPGKNWPVGTRLREVRSDPAAMAELVREWTTNRPAAFQKIIWYRLPIFLDVLNWRWPTLEAVMAGRSPRENLRVETSRPKKGLTEISLVNDGEADLSSRLAIEVRWQHARLVASDGLRDFEVVDPGPDTLQFRVRTNKIPSRLMPGQREAVGWLRLDGEEEVQIEIKKL